VGRFCCAPGARLQAWARDIVTTRSRTPVEHNLAAAESFQDVVNHFAVIQMFLPVWEHARHDLFTFEFSH
jgi:hypothetical protein